MGELNADTALLVNPCGEATLENGGACNLQDINLAAVSSVEEFVEAARLMHRWGKRVTCEKFHQPLSQKVIADSRRIGTGLTGCLENPGLFNPEVLDRVYAAIQEENVRYSSELNIPKSIRTTVIKPSGTLSKLMDTVAEGIHPAYSRYYIQRVRFSASDPLVDSIRNAGHHVEPAITISGEPDPSTVVADFYMETPQGVPVADEGFDTWKQLETVKMVQKHWADQSVSVTVYYKKNEIGKVKEWLSNNLNEIKTVSFLPHSDHGFIQAPKEAISKHTYERLSAKIKPIEDGDVGDGALVDSLECAGGACPLK
jgi:ribonucleoside-triphosphate reductase